MSILGREMSLWLLGEVSFYTLGGFIHILLALVMLLVQLLSGPRPIV